MHATAVEMLTSDADGAKAPGLIDIGRKAYGSGLVRENITRYVNEQFQKGSGESEKEANRRKRVQNARDISNNYYTLVTDFYEYGYGRSFHFAPVVDASCTLQECIVAYERETAKNLEAGPSMKLLVRLLTSQEFQIYIIK